MLDSTDDSLTMHQWQGSWILTLVCERMDNDAPMLPIWKWRTGTGNDPKHTGM
jgi:hypothetical protein